MFEDKLLKTLRDKQDEICLALAEHPVEDYAKYLKQVGKYQGLGIAIEELSSLLGDDNSEN
jgi:hypothetical protein